MLLTTMKEVGRNNTSTNKNGQGFPSHKQIFLSLHSQYITAHIGHRQVIREKAANDDVIL
jgi:hypothetical protein